MNIDRAKSAYGIDDANLGEYRILPVITDAKPNSRKALIVADTMGETNAVFPVAVELRKRGWAINAIVRNSGLDRFELIGDKAKARDFNLDKGFDDEGADVVITGSPLSSAMQTWATGWGNKIAALTVGVSDYPGNFIEARNEAFRYNPETLPRIVTVMDDKAKAVELAFYQSFGLPEDRTPDFLTTGHPNFDYIHGIDTSAESRRRLREVNGVPRNAKVFTWLGQIMIPTIESLETVVSAFREVDIQDSVLGVRLHPRDKKNIESNAYLKALNPIGRRRIIDLRSDVVKDIVDVILLSDLIIQERSTTAVEAAGLDVPGLSIDIPYLRQFSEMSSSLWVRTNEDGTTPVATNLDEMRQLLLLSQDMDFNRVQAKRRKYYKQDGKAAINLVDEIEQRVAE